MLEWYKIIPHCLCRDTVAQERSEDIARYPLDLLENLINVTEEKLNKARENLH